MINDPNFKKLYFFNSQDVDNNAPACGPDAYYEQAFAEINAGKRKSKWNWAAAVFPAPWLIYRQMYGAFIVLVTLVTALRVFFYDYTDLPYLCATGIYVVAFLGMGMLGTRLYLEHLKCNYKHNHFPDSTADMFGVIYTVVMGALALGIAAYIYFHNLAVMEEAGQVVTRSTQLVPQWFNLVKLAMVLHYPIVKKLQSICKWDSCRVK